MGMTKAFTALLNFGDKFIEDKDLRNQLNAAIFEAQAEVHIAALGAKTIPWVDALHKMWRPITNGIASAAPVAIFVVYPEIDFKTLALLTGGIAGPTGLYTFMKGKGR